MKEIIVLVDNEMPMWSTINKSYIILPALLSGNRKPTRQLLSSDCA